MKFTERIKESVEGLHIFGIPKDNKEEVKQSRAIVLGQIEQGVGVYANPDYRTMVETFYKDPVLKEGILMFADQVLSTGIFFSGNPEYKEALDGKTALDVIKEWADKNNLDTKLQDIVVELRAFGNSVWIINDMGFVKVPVEALWHCVKISDTVALQLKYNIRLTPIYGTETLKWGEFIHFRINTTGYNAPFGMGIMYGLLARPIDRFGKTCPSIYDIRLSMRGSLDEGFRKFSFGNVWIGVPDLSNEDFDNSGLAEQVANMKSTGNRVITNSDVKIGLEVPQRTQSYDSFIESMRNEFFMGLADPSLKLGLEQGFTKATSVTASEMYKFKIATMRKIIKQQLEDLFKQILNNMGYDGEKAAIKMNFGPEESPVYEIKDVFDAVKNNIIYPDEARKLLVEYHKWDIDSSKKAPEPKPVLAPNGVPSKDGNLEKKEEKPKGEEA